MAANSAFAPLQLQQFQLEDFQTPEGIDRFNQHISLLTQRLNAVQGNVGKVQFPAGVDMAGQSIDNVNDVGPNHSAITHAQAEARYSAKAISPQLEAGQPNSPKSLRRVNDSAQQELYSGFLNSAMSTAPTTNSSTITGSGTTVTVSSGFHYFVSGKVASYSARTDTFASPSSVTITSLSRTSSVVTASTSTALGEPVGSVINVTGATDSSFDGSFVLATAVGTTLTWRQVAPNATSIGGTVSSSGVFYYYLNTNSKNLSLAGPFTADSQENRLSINKDGSVLIAVAVLTGSGVDLTQSAAGATPPPATSGNHVLSRL